ncbi:MAG: MFS transporter, partial [Pseudonocardia sp.]|nr:MFS transporter [Pseudonocardia sp.]
AIGVLTVLAASYVVNAADRQVFPVLLKNINSDYGFTLSQGGLLATIFTLGIGLGGLPTGRLLDRFSRKSVMLVGIGIYSAFTVLTAYAFGFGDMAAYRALSGVGESLHNAALFSAVGAYFYTRRSLALGVLNLSYGLGSFLGPLVGAQLLTATSDWRPPLYVFGGLGFVFVLVIALGVGKRFTEVRVSTGNVGAPDGAAAGLPQTLRNRETVLLCLACAAAGLSLYSYLGLYPTFLQNSLGFSANQAGFDAGLFGIGSLVASVPAGYLGDKLGNRVVVMAALAAAIVVGALMFMVATGPGAQATLSFLEGAFGSGFVYVNLYAALQRSMHPAKIGMASGAFVAYFYIPSAGAGYVFAKLVSGLGWAGAAAVQLMFVSLLAIIFLLMIRPRREPVEPVAG